MRQISLSQTFAANGPDSKFCSLPIESKFYSIKSKFCSPSFSQLNQSSIYCQVNQVSVPCQLDQVSFPCQVNQESIHWQIESKFIWQTAARYRGWGCSKFNPQPTTSVTLGKKVTHCCSMLLCFSPWLTMTRRAATTLPSDRRVKSRHVELWCAL